MMNKQYKISWIEFVEAIMICFHTLGFLSKGCMWRILQKNMGVLMYQKEIHHEGKRWELDWKGKWLSSLKS